MVDNPDARGNVTESSVELVVAYGEQCMCGGVLRIATAG